MAYTLKYFDVVETYIHEAKIWYKEKKEGLEIEFAAAVAKALEHIVI